MDVRFCVLASGSSGNAALLLTPRAHVLIDAGLTPKELAARMAGTGAAWETISAVVLTHTHGDHVKATCLRECFLRRIPLYCHADHQRQLEDGRYLKRLAAAGLLRAYEDGRVFELPGEVRCKPLYVPHDCPPTFGFRLDALDAAGRVRGLAYLADLGHWTTGLTAEVRGVELLALEFNHDEELERASGRPWYVIERVLGPRGHLSNRQAAQVLAALLDGQPSVCPGQLVQLHMSDECNRPDLAHRAALEVVARLRAQMQIFPSWQDRRGEVLTLAPPRPS